MVDHPETTWVTVPHGLKLELPYQEGIMNSLMWDKNKSHVMDIISQHSKRGVRARYVFSKAIKARKDPIKITNDQPRASKAINYSEKSRRGSWVRADDSRDVPNKGNHCSYGAISVTSTGELLAATDLGVVETGLRENPRLTDDVPWSWSRVGVRRLSEEEIFVMGAYGFDIFGFLFLNGRIWAMGFGLGFTSCMVVLSESGFDLARLGKVWCVVAAYARLWMSSDKAIGFVAMRVMRLLS
ncbi:hypothetical protein PanWU01x14_046500 [Parasponia andersonii]|uniref:Uncharacterized protein n=1 Tax=Parasponia andersonii TaxID=3476 RepID=A0A2P5DNS0_PARAD|nr:hypothetical protein PanWU01x14_046500 [Parasponia andersonii]